MTTGDHYLNQEERQQLSAYESGELRSAPNFDERRKELRAAAREYRKGGGF
jgi:hypothetical protein